MSRPAVRRVARPAAVIVLLLMLGMLVACGGTEGGEGARPISPTRTPAESNPNPNPNPEPTRPAPTDAGPPSPTSDRSEGRDQAKKQASSAPPETAASAPTTTTAPPTEDQGVPTWVWWLLGGLLLGVAVAVPLVLRARRRRAWREQVAHAEAELAWFARDLLHGLRHAGSREEVAGGWRVGQPRVVAAEDRLTVLESQSPDEGGRERTRVLLDASRSARVRMERLTAPGPHDTWALDLDEIIEDLERALAAHSATPPA